MEAVIAPGARVVIRDAEWIVRRVNQTSDGGQQLVCDGISELVREKEAIFLTTLEGDMRVLDPADTELVPDTSPGFAETLLYIESQLRQSLPSDDKIRIGHCAAMDVVDYQLQPARQALAQPRQRILIADAVGLGKTLEAGILVSELIARGRGRRILVLTVKSMLTQFQKEFWNRFTIPLTRLDSTGIQRVRSRIPTNHNPFYYFDKAIISIDTLKQDAEYRTYLESAYWDIIIIDEAHNVADRGTGSLRSRLAKLLAHRSDTLIMLSATPHDGRARSFASLMNMLDATAIVDPEQYTQQNFIDKGLVIRRFKKDIQNQVGTAFRDREIYRRRFPASLAEESAFQALLEVTVAGRSNSTSSRDLFLVTLEKALFSSPAACLQTIEHRLHRRQKESQAEANEAVQQEVDSLKRLKALLIDIRPEEFAKYQALLEAIRGGKPFAWEPTDRSDRIVIFTERIETLHWLEAHLAKDLKLGKAQIATLHGGMSDIEQQQVVEDFGNADRPVRLLLCSDVASEGINLHYQCHRLVHFDMPWSLMVFQQRNGRVDRYGQAHTPSIVYLVTESRNETIRGDMRILEVLEQKDEQAYENIGDPSAFMAVHDIVEEESITTNAIANSEGAAAFDARLQPSASEGDNLLALFLGTTTPAGEDGTEQAETPSAPPSIFPSDLAYCEAALRRLREADPDLSFNVDQAGEVLTLEAPSDLRQRFGYCPPEVVPEHWRFVMTPSLARMREAIADSRKQEAAWPVMHYLWRMNPVIAWINDRMLASMGRHQAPVMAGCPGLGESECAFVISGLVPNRKSHPLIYEWTVVRFAGGDHGATEPFDAFAERLGLGKAPVPNYGKNPDLNRLRMLLPLAVEHARRWVIDKRNAFEKEVDIKLNAALEALDALKSSQLRQLELRLESSKQTDGFKRHREEQQRHEIDVVFDEYLDWIQDTMTTEKQPYLKVVCVMTGEV